MTSAESPLDVVIVGAGFGGMYAVHNLRRLGFRVRAFEAGSDVGGVWYWNRYPGARCDIESMEYSYSFDPELEQEWNWTQRYPTQPEMLAYARHVADRYDLRRDISFDTRVEALDFDENAALWWLTTDIGERVAARFCVMAGGVLSAPLRPEIPGIDSYSGEVLYTALWPHEPVDFAGHRVAVIGTGSSGIQSIPHIAAQADQLTVFQRTPNFSISGVNVDLDPEAVRQTKANYPVLRDHARRSYGGSTIPINRQSALAVSETERLEIYEERWKMGGFAFLGAFVDHTTDPAANELAAEFVREKIRSVVHDPDVAEILSPRDYPIGTKRICVDTGYYETFNRPNVKLVDLRTSPIEHFTSAGLLAGGTEYEFDTLVLATGFDALTGSLTRIDIRGRGGRLLRDEWRDGPQTYLGLAVEGFPNLFTVTGPGSPAVLSNMILSIEQHVDWIGEFLVHLREHGIPTAEAQSDAQETWSQHVADVAAQTLYPQANSAYMGSNVPGKARVFLPYVGGVGGYRKRCAAVAANGYEGFRLGA
ncbi:MAG: NAD(P)/FAD-dependent oxidoreductase [Actinomycetota bacterium]